MTYTKLSNKRGITLLEVSTVIFIVAVLSALAVFYFYLSARINVSVSPVTSNCRQILIALQVYAGDFKGEFPDMTDLEQVKKVTVGGYPAPGDGSTSTDHWQALISYGAMTSESIFYVRQDRDATGKRLVQPDDDLKTTRLEAENNGWSYMRGLDNGMPADIPLVFTQLTGNEAVWPAKGQGSGKAGGCWDGRIVVGRLGGDVIVEKLTKDGRVLRDGKDQFDPKIYWLDDKENIRIVNP